MTTFSSAAGTFDTACTVWLTALGVFQTAAKVTQAANVSQTNPYGSTLLGSGTGPAIARKLLAYVAFQQFIQECDDMDLLNRFAQGGSAGSADPLTVLATVFAAVGP
jgi:hypothetical protein